MILLVVGLLLVLISIPFYCIYNQKRNDKFATGYFKDPNTNNYAYTGNAFCIPGVILLIIAVLVGCVAWSDQVSDNVQIDKTYRVQELLNHKADALIPEFRQILAVEYPQYEKEIFSKISNPGAAEAFLVKYPELKASQTVMDFANRLGQLRNAVWDQKQHREDLIASTKVRKQSPWNLTFLVPAGHR